MDAPSDEQERALAELHGETPMTRRTQQIASVFRAQEFARRDVRVALLLNAEKLATEKLPPAASEQSAVLAAAERSEARRLEANTEDTRRAYRNGLIRGHAEQEIAMWDAWLRLSLWSRIKHAIKGTLS